MSVQTICKLLDWSAIGLDWIEEGKTFCPIYSTRSYMLANDKKCDLCLRNQRIILAFYKGKASKLRMMLAVYRLYRYNDWPPWTTQRLIERMFKIYNIHKRVPNCKNIVADTFRMLCLSDRECVFKKVLR